MTLRFYCVGRSGKNIRHARTVEAPNAIEAIREAVGKASYTGELRWTAYAEVVVKDVRVERVERRRVLFSEVA